METKKDVLRKIKRNMYEDSWNIVFLTMIIDDLELRSNYDTTSFIETIKELIDNHHKTYNLLNKLEDM